MWNRGWMYLKHPELGNPANFHHSQARVPALSRTTLHHLLVMKHIIKNPKLTLSRALGRTSFQGEAELWPCFFKFLSYWINLSVSGFVALSFFSFNQLYNLIRTMGSVKDSSSEILEFAALVLLGPSSCAICCLAGSHALLPSQQLIPHNPLQLLKVCFTDWKAPSFLILFFLFIGFVGFDSKPKKSAKREGLKFLSVGQCCEFKSQGSQGRVKGAPSLKGMALYGQCHLRTYQRHFWGKAFYWLDEWLFKKKINFQVTL